MKSLQNCCIICSCSILILLPIVLPIVLIYTVGAPKGPKCYIQELYVPGLDLSLKGNFGASNSSTITRRIVNPSIFFDLALRNGMKYYYVLYDDINLTFSFGGNTVGSYVVPSFFQENKNTAYRREVVQTRGIPWDGVLGEVANGSKAVFRVDLDTKARFYYQDSETGSWGKTKAKSVRVATDVEVDGSGMKVEKGYIRLNTAASKPRVGVLVLIVVVLDLILI